MRAGGVAPRTPRPAFTGDPQADLAAFRPAYLALAEEAGATLDQGTLAHEALRGLVGRTGDCGVGFADPAQVAQRRADAATRSTYVGVGLRYADVLANSPSGRVLDVYPGSPAERAGIRPGDRILAVDAVDVTGLLDEAVAGRVRGPAGSAVTLTLQRPGVATARDLILARTTVFVPNLAAHVVEGSGGVRIGYLRLYEAGDGADAEVGRALAGFEAQGVTAWVLDLRDTRGGTLTTWAALGGRFVRTGRPVFSSVDRNQARRIWSSTRGDYLTPQRPTAMLIDRFAQSGAEILAATAQDYAFARVFGERTAGCANAYTDHQLADGSALHSPSVLLFSAKERNLAGAGLQPDETVVVWPAATADPTLDAALAWAGAQR